MLLEMLLLELQIVQLATTVLLVLHIKFLVQLATFPLQARVHAPQQHLVKQQQLNNLLNQIVLLDIIAQPQVLVHKIKHVLLTPSLQQEQIQLLDHAQLVQMESIVYLELELLLIVQLGTSVTQQVNTRSHVLKVDIRMSLEQLFVNFAILEESVLK